MQKIINNLIDIKEILDKSYAENIATELNREIDKLKSKVKPLEVPSFGIVKCTCGQPLNLSVLHCKAKFCPECSKPLKWV